ncbi:conserved hypothetical protein [Vibrio coralliirubri]|uniref:hypothetical protein n=1 Tax=Vibrio coralliirubri TaxID=1516159 RepID=UPI000637A452|nr:hypothetical protein [Vibrio coralliirubri]CDT53695.1 conserved hypothetical protein [Vibrio coralliirubri]
MSDLSPDELDEIALAEEEAERDALKISASLRQFIDPYQLKKDVSFSDHDLDEAMAKQASLYSYYGTQAAKAQLQSDRAKNDMEIVEAKLYHEIRNKNKGEKVTESFISKGVMIDKRYRAAVKRYNDARMIADMAKQATEALKHRRDMLVQCSKHQLEEFKGELFLKSKEAGKEDMKAKVLGKIRESKENR